jgi:hypothetical protein
MADWKSYDRWNAAIAEVLFCGRYGSRPVYLDFEEETLREVAHKAGANGEPAAALVAAVAPTLDLETSEHLLEPHVRRLRSWSAGEHASPPPVVALLGYFSLVAERMRAEGDLAASNYYGRFISMLGGDPHDEDLKSKVYRAFAESSGTLWTALNDWLEEEPEVRGVPTAFAFDHRSYVGPAMSQALVRDSDRRALRSLFAEAGLRPRQIVGVDDMVRILEDWLPEAPLSTGIKRLASSQSVLTRIAEIARVELAAWSGSSDEDGSQRTERVILTASLRRIPRRSLRLGIAVLAPADVASLAPGPDCDEAGRAVVGAAAEALELEEPDSDGWRAVAGKVGLGDLLPARLELIGEHGFLARRQPRPVVVLARAEGSELHREVDRARLTGEHMLLVVESSRSRLENELRQVAREGYEVHESIPGLPLGWLLYTGVEIVSISETTAPDLAVLLPLAWTEVSLEGGMKLPGKATWHSRAAPELKATAASGRTVEVVLHGPDEESRALGRFAGTLIVDVNDEELEDGDYRVELRDPDEDRELGTVSMKLRSADVASADAEDLVDERGPEDGPLWPLTAEPLGLGDCGLEREQRGDPSGEAEEEEGDGEEAVPPPSVEVPSCYLTGAHYIDLPPAGRERPRGRYATIEGCCRFCGLEKHFPARPRQHGRRRGSPATAPSLAIPPRIQTPPFDYDLLLDSLSFIGADRAERIRSLLNGYEVAPWAPTEALRTLSALGHIDVTLDRRLRPAAWRVAPATIVLAPTPFLLGFRSERLVYEIGDATELRYEAQQDAPARILLPGLDGDEAAALVASLRLPVRVIDCPAHSLADSLPSLLALRRSLPPLMTPPLQGVIERLEGHHWRPVDLPSTDGAYRTKRIPRTIWHRRGDDIRLAEGALVKWLTLSPHELMTIGPDRTVSCRLGAEPPWLYERALVLSSGLAPVQGPEYTTVYREVPPSIAEAMIASMTEERGLSRA